MVLFIIILSFRVQGLARRQDERVCEGVWRKRESVLSLYRMCFLEARRESMSGGRATFPGWLLASKYLCFGFRV